MTKYLISFPELDKYMMYTIKNLKCPYSFACYSLCVPSCLEVQEFLGNHEHPVKIKE